VLTSDYTDNTVTELVTYYYVVKAVDNGANESGYSNEDNAMVDLAPAKPTGLVATPGDKQVSLDWDDNTDGDLTGYKVYRSMSSGGSYSEIASLGLTSDYIDTGLTGGITYYYVVTAMDNGVNESVDSDEASATPTDPPPAAPTGLAATPDIKQISLDWDDNGETDLAGYKVYRSTSSGGPYTEIASLGITSNYTDTGLTGGFTYYYVVTAVDGGVNESGYSSEANATAAGITLLNDGFEGSPWDLYWDGNFTTDWQLSSAGSGYSGTYCADHANGDTYLTSDDLDASGAANITVSFWFKIKTLNKGPLNVQIYNGSSWTTWYNLTSTPGYTKNTWGYFSQTITDSQFFISNFSLRFDGSGLSTDSYIDDVLVQKN
jgi:fibronectin type 3 domain-containing protein